MEFDTRYAVDALETSFQQPVEQVVTVGQVAIARDSQLQDGLVAQRARKDKNAADIVGQLVPDAIHLGAGLDAFRPHVLVPIELQEDLRLVFGGLREHPLHARQRRERLLDGAGYQAFDLFRRRTFVRDLDEDPGKLDVREFLERQEPRRNQPDQRKRNEHDHGRHGPTKCDLGVFHDWLGAAVVAIAAGQRLRSSSE